MTRSDQLNIRTETHETWLVRHTLIRRRVDLCAECGRRVEQLEEPEIQTTVRRDDDETES